MSRQLLLRSTRPAVYLGFRLPIVSMSRVELNVVTDPLECRHLEH